MNPNTPQPNDQPVTPDSDPATPSPVTPEEAPVVDNPASATPEFAPEPSTDSTPAPETPVSAPEVTPAAPDPGVEAPTDPFAASNPAPTEPEAAPLTTPDAAAPVAAVAPTPEPKNTKRLGKLLALVLGIIVLAAAAFAVYFFMNTVSKEDYAAAATQYNEVNAAASSMNREIGSLTSAITDDQAEFDAAVKEVETSVATLKTETNELSGLKAVKVGEGKKLFDTFNTKLNESLTFSDQVLASVKSIRPAMIECEKISDTTNQTERVAAIKACSESFNKVTDTPQADFKALVDSLKTQYAQYATTYEKMAAIADPSGAQRDEYRELRDQVYQIQDTIRDASRTFSTAMNAAEDKVSVKESARALADYLNEQQRN